MANSEKSPYQVLHVPEDITYVELRAVYRTKIHKHLQNRLSPVKFRRICRAYEALSDYDKRNFYDTQKQWLSELSIDKYTVQQLAAEPSLIHDLKQRLRNSNLTIINGQDPTTGHTTLYTAARAGNVEAVKFLTDQGADPDLSQRTKSTALHAASFYGHADVVRCLLESGADYRITNEANNTAEAEAYNHDVLKVFAELKQNDYVRVAANELDWFMNNGLTQHQDIEYFDQRQTLLHCASKKGHSDLVQWLVEQRSANIDLTDFNGNSALHLAAYGGHVEVVDYLLRHGGDPTLRNRWGTTAEQEGMKHGDKVTNILKSIRERDMFDMAKCGIDWWFDYYFNVEKINAADSDGRSLLYHACRWGKYSVAKWLLDHGADVNIQMENKPKSTPLHVAKYRGYPQIVELLLEYGADINIKNGFGANIFEEDTSAEVNRTTADKIEEILQQYKSNLRSDKLLDIQIYDDTGEDEYPIIKIKLGLGSTYRDLLDALPKDAENTYPYFSIARRVLVFRKEDTTIMSAIACARYASSKFIDTPICLIRHETLPDIERNVQPTHIESKLVLRLFSQDFDTNCTTTSHSLKYPLKSKQTIQIKNLMLIFSEDSIYTDVNVQVSTIFKPDPEKFGVPGCICLFKIELDTPASALLELPMVSIVDEPEARLYTLAQPSSYWLSSNTRRTYLSAITCYHAFVRHISIIPNHLTLPVDMFIANVLEQPLELRNDPVPCKRLSIRKHNSSKFDHIGYHGANIIVIQSILHDGLVVPGTLTASGKRVNPPKNHFARGSVYFGVNDYAAAVFLSPSIHYSSDPVYAIAFSHNDQQLIPVLECSVKSESYSTYPCTVSGYKKQPGDDMKAIEWRVVNPRNIEINAILFIIKIESIAASTRKRITRNS